MAAGLVVAMATLSAATFSSAMGPNPPAPLDRAAFELIVGSDLAYTAATLREPAASRGPAPLIADFANPERSFAPRPEPSLVVAPRVVTTAKPRPAPPGSGHRVKGRASWYCLPGVSRCTSGHQGGLYAAAGSELRIGKWRGRVVKVCGNGNCVNVTLIDWCACGGSRIIDLYNDAFRRLASPSVGTVAVTVTW